jgi:hypothetical protein
MTYCSADESMAGCAEAQRLRASIRRLNAATPPRSRLLLNGFRSISSRLSAHLALIVSIDSKDVVTEVDYASTGER